MVSTVFLKYFKFTQLANVDFSGSDISDTYFHNCNLHDANFTKAKINPDNPVLAEILRQEAGADIERLKIAGLILVTPVHFWKDHVDWEWILGVLHKYDLHKVERHPTIYKKRFIKK